MAEQLATDIVGREYEAERAFPLRRMSDRRAGPEKGAG